jgi:hypothetical protein
MSQRIVVLGYHGTSARSAELILGSANRSHEFLDSENDTDWLGDGVYFFQDAPYRAVEWPKIRMPPPARTMDPVVLCAEIELTDCLDLIDIKASEVIVQWYPQMTADYRRRRLPLPKNVGGRRRRDRALINFVVEGMERSGTKVNAVRAAFKEGHPIVPGSQLYSHAHIQIVIRPHRADVIKDVWLHKFEGDER